ncbi:MAG TPA: VWA domain-containing protein [Candidatus Acidoferrales bacterium]|nr:VWA domain-containing protein [Candidatus Acidoferrales bacterium]
MFRLRDKAGLLAGLCASALAAQPASTIRVNVNLVRAVATVKTQAGQVIGTLRKEDFEIYDNGVKQQVAVFEHQAEQRLSVALLVDVSGSTAKELAYEADSGLRFVHALFGEGNPDDALKLYTFNWQVTDQTGRYTRDLKLLSERLKTMHGEAGTAMYDAIFFAARDLEPREGRKVIVVVTDGGDTVSKLNLQAALEEAQLADAVIYAIVVVPITNEAGRNIGGEHALQFMAEGTGGRIFMPSIGSALDKAFTDILTELRTQYLLGFYPRDVPPGKNRFHKLEVRVKNPDLRVSARNGYYGEVEGGEGSSDQRVSISPERQPVPVKKKK